MKIWIPEKKEIEIMLFHLYGKLRKAETVYEVEKDLRDELLQIEIHIFNRAAVEKGDIKEDEKVF